VFPQRTTELFPAEGRVKDGKHVQRKPFQRMSAPTILCQGCCGARAGVALRPVLVILVAGESIAPSRVVRDPFSVLMISSTLHPTRHVRSETGPAQSPPQR
jgi:hypothetical protein